MMSVPVRTTASVAVVLLGLLPAACGSKDNGTPNGPHGPGPGLPAALRFTPVASGLSDPVFIASPPGDPRLFVLERPGRIRIVAPGRGLVARPFLDIRDLVGSGGGEQGLLGLAFEPDYARSGHLYVNYTDVNGDTRIVRYRVSSDPDSAIATGDSVQVILTVPQPFANHNGGMLAFGPDGMLYVGLGDGGGGGDPNGNGQDTGVLLGKLLRIDVTNHVGYASPPDNPFAGSGRPEVWAYGLRNPWRFSFDRSNGDLYIADVGQGQREEVDVASAASGAGRGLNFGWDRMEGLRCFEPSSGCDTTGLAMPVLDYDHSQGCSVIGGYVYRGSAIPGLRGHYLYADYCGRWVRSFRYAGGQATERTSWATLGSSPLSFGEDAAGELYVGLDSGTVMRISP